MKGRDYKRERELAIRRGETGVGSKSGDATRHRARRMMEKRVGKTVLSGKEVDHKRPIKSGGGNSPSNLRVRSVSANRSAGGKSGNAKEKGKRKP